MKKSKDVSYLSDKDILIDFTEKDLVLNELVLSKMESLSKDECQNSKEYGAYEFLHMYLKRVKEEKINTKERFKALLEEVNTLLSDNRNINYLSGRIFYFNRIKNYLNNVYVFKKE